MFSFTHDTQTPPESSKWLHIYILYHIWRRMSF
jgi:hypothetical protein